MLIALPLLLVLALASPPPAGGLELDDTPPKSGEWGFHPEEGQALRLTPPGFSWRPQPGASSYEVMVRGPEGEARFEGLDLNVFCPPRPLPPGSYTWKYRYQDREGAPSPWSRERAFVILEGAEAFPLPERMDLMARIPRGHPRLFLRPEEVPSLREASREARREEFDAILRQCDALLRDPPPTPEPPKYPKGTVPKSEAWREIWWGNRVYTIRVLESAATLAFAGLIKERPDYREAAKRLLLAAAAWDPEGSTGYRYNDEAGMPFAYHFSRAYTFLHGILAEEERALCRTVMKRRGEAMYRHLCPRHLWRPYSNHSNRAWHFLGEAGIAFLDEIPEAEDWVWFAVNVFRSVYPVWSDQDGGWHEGMAYWQGYIGRFTWWADVMKAAMGIDAYRKSYFSKVGYYPLYMMPPGQEGGGFGDLCGGKTSKSAVPLMAILAAQAGNPHWQWYMEAHGDPPPQPGYIGFLRGRYPRAAPVPPAEFPASRLFEGTGQAVLNRTLLDAAENVQVLFKSSPFGTQSHGYESQNAFLLNVAGERILIRSGHRDIYGSAHHRDWMWDTRSVNSITVNGKGQGRHTPSATGKIIEFQTGKWIDYAAGEAGAAYGDRLTSFIRRILFIKPDLIILFDTLAAPEPSTFEWRLHAPYPMETDGEGRVLVEGERGAARIHFLLPENLEITVTDRFDPPPRPRVRLEQWHLTASLKEPAKDAVFITAIRPYLMGRRIHGGLQIARKEGAYGLHAGIEGCEALIRLRTKDGDPYSAGHEPKPRIAVWMDGIGSPASFESLETLN